GKQSYECSCSTTRFCSDKGHPMETPASLLERLRQPAQDQAWARFVELHTPLLYTWARSTGCQESDAADLVQDVLLLLVRKLPPFASEKHKSFRGWLHTLPLNKWRERRRRTPPAPAGGKQDLHEIPGAEELGAFEEDEYRRYLVQRALQTLRPE